MNWRRTIIAVAVVQASTASVFAQVLAYEPGSVFPEQANPSWERVGTSDADRALQDGWFICEVDLGAWAPPPGGEQDYYRRSISELTGFSFFAQWRCMNSASAKEIPLGGGIGVNSTGLGVSNHFTIGREIVRIWRSNFVSPPFLYVNIEADVPHTYRVEHVSDELYAYYIDGQLVDSGIPLGAFPNPSARIIWGSQMREEPNTSRWDYIRYGVIPTDFSGDYDSDGDVDATDLYFFVDCLLGPAYDAAGPGCRWADMNADGVANGSDISLFTQAMLR